MDNIKLSAREALGSSLSFLAEFIKKHWILVLIYFVLSVVPVFIIGDQEVTDISLSKRLIVGVIGLINVIPGLLMVYYPLREALLKLNPTGQISNKSIAKALWQIFCTAIISVIIGVPLLLLLLLPCIWWATKASVSYANLLSTEDGPIQSIRKSHELMNGRFWSSFGFLFSTMAAVFFVWVIAMMIIVFFLLIGGAFNAIFHEGAGFNKVLMIIRLLGPFFSVATTILFHYYQVWLYVYLKSQNSPSQVITA
jgi:hypothetical protein